MQPQQQLRQIHIHSVVNHPVGAPQFVAISALSDDHNRYDDDGNLRDDAVVDTTTTDGQVPLEKRHAASTTSDKRRIFTALPHDRGAFGGVVYDEKTSDGCGVRSHGSSVPPEPVVQRVQCFSTWSSHDSYRGMLALLSGGSGGGAKRGEGIGAGGDDDDDDLDEAFSGLDNSDVDENNNDAGSGNDDDDGDGDAGKKGASSSANPLQYHRPKPKPKRRKRTHVAFRRQAESLPEAWYVLDPKLVVAAASSSIDGGKNNSSDTSPSSSSVIEAYDMLPLTEVFSCQPRPLELKSQRIDGKAPTLNLEGKVKPMRMAGKIRPRGA